MIRGMLVMCNSLRHKARHVLILFLVCSFALMQGCTQVKHLFRLRSELVKQFGETDIEIGLADGTSQGKTLEVAFINSKFNELDPEQRKAKAREIAAYIKEHYESIAVIETIAVEFVSET